jgi:hypothetical protein
MKTATTYVIERQNNYRGQLECCWWTGKGWSTDLRDARRFASQESASNYARLNIGTRLWMTTEL